MLGIISPTNDQLGNINYREVSHSRLMLPLLIISSIVQKKKNGFRKQEYHRLHVTLNVA